MKPKYPYEDSKLAKFVTHRVLELKAKKSQGQVAFEAGFVNPNVISLIKSGKSKCPLDRVPALARALDCDPRRLLLLALEQEGMNSALTAIESIIGTVVTENEAVLLNEFRDASDHSDPPITARIRRSLRALFGK